jgi:PAS domain S-box-containing protein
MMNSNDPGAEAVSLSTAAPQELEAAWQIFRHANEGILITDEQGKIQTINPAIERMFGYTATELMGNRVELLMTKETAGQHGDLRDGYFKNPYSRPMKGGETLMGRTKTGKNIPLEISLSSFKTDTARFAIAFIVNRTELYAKEDLLKKNQQDLVKLSDQLREANSQLEIRVKRRTQMLEETISELNDAKEQLRMSLEKEKDLGALKSNFASLVSHEFRTPLATILSSLNLMERYSETGMNDNQRKHAGRIRKSVQVMVDIINDMLTITRIDKNQLEINPEEIELGEFLGGLLSDLAKLLKTGQHFQLTGLKSASIISDKAMLTQVITNLVANAIKFSGEGKPISIDISNHEKGLCLVVKDEGIGIPKTEIGKLQESFFRASNASDIEGTGLGLFIVQKCVQLLQGAVKIESEQGVGTTINICLPFKTNAKENIVD